MKKKNIVLIFLLLMGIIYSAVYMNAGNREVEETVTEVLPKVMSPEETLKIYLNAFIMKDIDTVMAYFPNGKGEKIVQWRERMKAISEAYMTDKRHIIGVDSIKLLSNETQNNQRIAILEATIITTPDFSKAVSCDEKGKCTVTLRWTFRQWQQDGPWLYDGGGF